MPPSDEGGFLPRGAAGVETVSAGVVCWACGRGHPGTFGAEIEGEIMGINEKSGPPSLASSSAGAFVAGEEIVPGVVDELPERRSAGTAGVVDGRHDKCTLVPLFLPVILFKNGYPAL